MTNRIALALLLAPIAACKCGSGIVGNSENLNCPPWDAGGIGVLVVEHSGKTAMLLSAVGNSPVEISSVQIFDDGGGFSQDDGGQVIDSGFIPAGVTEVLGLRFVPQQPGPDIAYIQINTDNGACISQLIGNGIDECAAIELDGGCDAGIDTCAGPCTNGSCHWPTSDTGCADGTKCITVASGGTCNGAGACVGPNACTPSGTCNGSSYTGQIATNPDGTGTCSASSSPYVAGTCLFTTSTEQCDCGCGTREDGTTGCLYNWVVDPGSPTPAQAFGSVWVSQSGDAWATASTGVPQGNTIAQAFYERVGGTWTQQATLPLGTNPLAGSSSTVALTGDQNGNLFGAAACSFEDTLSECGDAGIWKWSNGAATVEPLSPPVVQSGCGNTSDFPVTYPVMLGSTPAFLNSDACGPEIMTETDGGQFAIVGGSQIQLHCSALASLWGTSPTDIFLAWGCGGSGGNGGIWHYIGTGLSSTPAFPFNAGDYAEAIAGTGDNDIWAVGTQRWHYTNGTWTVSATPPPNGNPDESLWSVGDSNNTYFAAGNYPGVYHYDGTNWNLECLAPGYSGNDSSVNQVAGDSQGNFYAATPEGIFKRQDAGQ